MNPLESRSPRRPWFHLLSTSLLTLILAVSAAAAPVSQKITYAQFESLVQHKVSEVPDLAPLWTGPYRYEAKFAGGALRGLLLWIQRNLETHSLAEVTAMKTPSVQKLLLQGDADRDLLAADHWVEEIKHLGGYQGWDVLDETFFRQSAADGGAGLDRVAVSPWQTRDELGGLHDFYRGVLNYRENRVQNLGGNTPMALALRFLRFEKEFESAAQPDALALQAIRRIGLSASLPANQGITIQDKDSVRYWVKKALSKFVKAYKDDYVAAFVRLRDLNLLEPLGTGGYFVADVRVTNPRGLVKELAKRGFSFHDVLQVGRMTAWGDIDTAIAFQKELRKLATNDYERRRAVNEIFSPVTPVQRSRVAFELEKGHPFFPVPVAGGGQLRAAKNHLCGAAYGLLARAGVQPMRKTRAPQSNLGRILKLHISPKNPGFIMVAGSLSVLTLNNFVSGTSSPQSPVSESLNAPAPPTETASQAKESLTAEQQVEFDRAFEFVPLTGAPRVAAAKEIALKLSAPDATRLGDLYGWLTGKEGPYSKGSSAFAVARELILDNRVDDEALMRIREVYTWLRGKGPFTAIPATFSRAANYVVDRRISPDDFKQIASQYAWLTETGPFGRGASALSAAESWVLEKKLTDSDPRLAQIRAEYTWLTKSGPYGAGSKALNLALEKVVDQRLDDETLRQIHRNYTWLTHEGPFSASVTALSRAEKYAVERRISSEDFARITRQYKWLTGAGPYSGGPTALGEAESVVLDLHLSDDDLGLMQRTYKTLVATGGWGASTQVLSKAKSYLSSGKLSDESLAKLVSVYTLQRRTHDAATALRLAEGEAF